MSYAVSALAGLMMLLHLVGCGFGSDPRSDAAVSGTTEPHGATGLSQTAGKWTILISVEPHRVGPIRLEITDAAPPREGADPWLQHDLLFRNVGGRPVSFADLRTSKFLGPARHPGILLSTKPMLLAADEGCGYEKQNARVIPGVCRAYLDILTVKPHRSEARTVTLAKGLPGMGNPIEGRYVFRKPIRFRVGMDAPGQAAALSAVLRLTYELDRALVR